MKKHRSYVVSDSDFALLQQKAQEAGVSVPVLIGAFVRELLSQDYEFKVTMTKKVQP